ncbi:MAG: hypothetical protein ABW022_26475 [Actinoplanes sp.]
MSIDTTVPVVPANMRRVDGTPLTPTCEIPIKPCCREVLLGEECDCSPADLAVFDQPLFLDLRATVNA